jgi:hypothetical protein
MNPHYGNLENISNVFQFLRVLAADSMAIDDFFRARILEGKVDLRHPLAVLPSRMRRGGLWAQ